MAAVAWPYNDLGDVEEVSILEPDLSRFVTIFHAEETILEPDFSQFVTILQAEAFILKEDFHVTIWTNTPRTEYFFQYLKVQLYKSMACMHPTHPKNCQKFPQKRDMPSKAMIFTT